MQIIITAYNNPNNIGVQTCNLPIEAGITIKGNLTTQYVFDNRIDASQKLWKIYTEKQKQLTE